MSKENFYLLLELPLDENNTTSIEAVIKYKQTEWSRLRNHPTKGRMAQQYLDLIPEIKKVMTDKKLRQLEATEAKRLQEQKQKEKFQELDEYIKILSAKGKILEQEVQKLVKTFSSLPETAIRKRIKVAIVKEDKQNSQKTKPLDKTSVKIIADNLKIVSKSSLYEFLNLSPTSNLKTLQKRTNEKDADIKKIAQKDAQITASSSLIGHCQSIFKTQEMREAYDATLAQQRLVALDKAIEVACWTGRVQAPEYELLLKKAISLGLDKEKAREYILEDCQKRNCSVEIGIGKSVVDNLQSCGTCGFSNPATAHNCENCGYPLKVKCPHCDTENASTVQYCRSCGFALGDMPNAVPLLREAKLALIDKNLNLAQQLLQQAEIYWPHHPEIVEALQTIQSQKQAVDDVAQKLRSLTQQRYFYQARDILAALRKLDNSHPELSLEKRIEQQIQAAETWLQKANTVRKETELIEVYTKALAEARDCQVAIDNMAKLPPKPATALTAKVSLQDISLHWTASISRGDLIYQVIRQTEHLPKNQKDGELIGETAHTQFEDSKTEAGQAYYYAIYTVRGQAFSNPAATVGPIMQLAEVKNLQVIPGDSCIHFKWQIPAKTYQIEVWRKENGIPQNREAGDKVSGVRWDGVTDVGLKNDTLYGYLINLVFQDGKGHQFFSQGITSQSRPLELPLPVEDLTIVKQNHYLDISWTSPSKGSVELFYSEQPIAFSKGESLPTSRLSELGKPITIQRLGHVKYPIHFQGTLYIIPVTVIRDIAVIGEVKMETAIHEVTNLQGFLSYNKLYLEWQWPPGAQQALVTYRHDAYPKTVQDASIRQFITKETYHKAAAFVIQQPEEKNYYFTVFVVAGDEKNRTYSKGQQCFVEKSGYQDIFYEIKTKKGLFGKIHTIQLILKTPGHSITLPEAVLVRKNNDLPLRRIDGQTIHRLSNERIHNKLVITIPYQETYKNSYVKLFFTDKKNEQKYRLVAVKNKLFLK
jgi:ribosomal protein L40E